MTMRALAVGCVCGVVVGWGCGSEAEAVPDTVEVESEAESEVESEVESEFESEVEVEVEVESESESESESEVESEVEDASPVAATEYCERIVDSFCDYYVRCGRIAVPDVATCRGVFLETCNARYEPLWVDLADRELVALSAPGIAACAAHLADVTCEQQIFDLDGGCQGVWQGLVPAGGTCGPGLASFVCDPSTTCIVGLDFCGECVPLAAPGATCDLTHRCPNGATCDAGTCAVRSLPGEPCDAETTCVIGATCDAGTCRADAIVTIGDACDDRHACPYKALCTTTPAGARCVESRLLGEPCGEGVGCASGWCDGGTCARLGTAGTPCAGPASCVSGRCSGGVCGPIALIDPDGPACYGEP